jgi:hypothetical protein
VIYDHVWHWICDMGDVTCLNCVVSIWIYCSVKSRQSGSGLMSGGVLFEQEFLGNLLGYSVILVVEMTGHACQYVPRPKNGLMVEKGCRAAIAFQANLATSMSGLVLSKTLIFSSFHVAVIAYLLSHTCSMVGGEKPYTFRIRVMMVNAAMLPHISAL